MTVARPHFLSDLVEMSHCQPHLSYPVHSYKRENTCSIKLLYPGGSSCHHVRFKMSKYHKTQLYYFKIGCPPKSRTFKNIKKSLKQTDSRLVKHRFLSFLFWLHNKAENKSSTSLKHTLSTAGLRKDNGESPGMARNPPTGQQVHENTQRHKCIASGAAVGSPECSPPTSRMGRQQRLGCGHRPLPITTAFLHVVTSFLFLMPPSPNKHSLTV